MSENKKSTLSTINDIFLALGILYLLYLAVKGMVNSFRAGDPDYERKNRKEVKRCGGYDRVLTHSGSDLFVNALISGAIISLLCPPLFMVIIPCWMIYRFRRAKKQLKALSDEYKATASESPYKLYTSCCVRPGSKFSHVGYDFRFDSLYCSCFSRIAEEYECEAVIEFNTLTKFQKFFSSLSSSSVGHKLKIANRDARYLGFLDIYDYCGYRMYHEMVTNEVMSTDKRKEHIEECMNVIVGCGFGDEDLKRWYGYLMSVKHLWELEPYIPSVETDVDVTDISEEEPDLDEFLDKQRESGAKILAVQKRFRYTVPGTSLPIMKFLYATDLRAAKYALDEMGVEYLSLVEVSENEFVN